MKEAVEIITKLYCGDDLRNRHYQGTDCTRCHSLTVYGLALTYSVIQALLPYSVSTEHTDTDKVPRKHLQL